MNAQSRDNGSFLSSSDSSTSEIGIGEHPVTLHDQLRHSADNSMNDAQKLHFRMSCQYIDKLLSNIEIVLHASASKSPFPKYKLDINLAQIRVLEDYIRRFRTQLLSALAWQHIAPAQPEIPATRAIGVNLTFIDVTLADMRPVAMRGSGELQEALASQLSGIVQELGALTESMMNYVRREIDESLRDRIGSLSPNDAVRLIGEIEAAITRRGLVEFRPRLDILLSRLEEHTFEVAVFGRVNSGKSSFLNAILQTDVLPVGVNPITAVPTRISFGNEAQAWVRYGVGELVRVSLEEFRALVSEQQNPGNERAVTRALIKLPSQYLTEGIMLVDTPGLGSLARKGAAETKAYLPSCDLALILVDAVGTLNDEDIATLRLIRETGIQAMVVLSKCDLLDRGDTEITVRYVEKQISDHLQENIPVFPVSSLKAERSNLEAFLSKWLRPRIEQAETLKSESNRRKLERLRADVLVALETSFDRQKNRSAGIGQSETREIESRMRSISANVGELEESLQGFAQNLRGKSKQILIEAADRLTPNMAAGRTVTSLEVDSFINEAVISDVRRIIALLQRVAGNAIEAIRDIATKLGRSDVPDESELDTLVRDAPQFEIVLRPFDLSASVWKLLGQGVVRTKLLRSLLDHHKSHLDQQLENYARTFELWSRSVSRSLQHSVESYLEAYRGILQTEIVLAPGEQNPTELRDDIRRLREWNSSTLQMQAAKGE